MCFDTADNKYDSADYICCRPYSYTVKISHQRQTQNPSRYIKSG